MSIDSQQPEMQQEQPTQVLALLSYPTATEVDRFFMPFQVAGQRNKVVPLSYLYKKLLEHAAGLKNGRDKGSMDRRIKIFELLAKHKTRRYLWDDIDESLKYAKKSQLSDDLTWLFKMNYIKKGNVSRLVREYWVE